jgi:hypothetical protein
MLVLAMEFSRVGAGSREDPAGRLANGVVRDSTLEGVHSLKTEQKSPTPPQRRLEDKSYDRQRFEEAE